MNKLFKYQEFVKHTLNESIQDVINEEIIDNKEWPIEKTRELFTITNDNFKTKLQSELDKFIEINITQDKELFSTSKPSGIYGTYRESKLAEIKYKSLNQSFGAISDKIKSSWVSSIFQQTFLDKYKIDEENFKNWKWAKSEIKKNSIKNSFEIASKIANVGGNKDITIINALIEAKGKAPKVLWEKFENYIINGTKFWYDDATDIVEVTIRKNTDYDKYFDDLELIKGGVYKELRQAIENKFKEYYTLYRIYMFANALADGMENVKVKTAETTSNIATTTSSSKEKVRTTSSEPIRKLSSSERQSISATRSGL